MVKYGTHNILHVNLTGEKTGCRDNKVLVLDYTDNC